MPQAPTVAVPARVPLGWNIESRDATLSKDAKLVNCYLEKDRVTGETHVYRRPGFQLAGGAVTGDPAYRGAGIFTGANGLVYYTFGNRVYDMVAPGTPLIVFTGTSTLSSFESIPGGNPCTVVTDGTNAYTIDYTDTVTGPIHTIDADYPANTAPGYAYLDGSLYVIQQPVIGPGGTASAVIWGSAINIVSAPGSWDPLDFITAQMSPDYGVFLTKQLGYVVCMKASSTEFFYDAGNATGSPLAPAENLYLPIGCANPHTVQKIGETLVWVAINKDSLPEVVVMDNTRPMVVSTPEIERVLASINVRDPTQIIYSWHLKISGHTFYVLTLKNLNLTLVCDLSERMWYQWTDQAGNYLPFVSTTQGIETGFPLVQHETNGFIYQWSTTYSADYVQDGSVAGTSPFIGHSIPITMITPRWDGGTSIKKNLNALFFVGDIIPGKIITVQASDDDYTTWSTPKTVDLGMDYPNLMNCGTFRRRSWRLTSDDFLPFRMQAMELQTDLGTL